MAGEWTPIRFGQMAQLVRDTVDPAEAVGLPYIGLEHIGEGSLSLVGLGVAENATSLKYRFKRGDILFGKLRPYFRKVIRATFEGICSTDIWVCQPRIGVDAGFLFYLMASDLFIEPVVRASEGTKMPRAQWEFACDLELSLPTLLEQRAIAHILGTLDDKIELNRRMSETLEAMARALFKSWFVDFDPVRAKADGRWRRGQSLPGLPANLYDLFPSRLVASELGEIPEGFEVAPFADTVDIIGGGTPKTSVPEYWGGTIPWFSVVDAPSSSEIWVVETEKKVTPKGVESSSTKVLPIGTTIISARGTVGRVALVGVPMAMNQSCYGLRGKYGTTGFFNYFSIRALVSVLLQRAHGSVFDTITRDTLSCVPVVVPTELLVNAFESLVRPLVEHILNNVLESHTLAALRDALLPKLISGELRVKDAERFVQKAVD